MLANLLTSSPTPNTPQAPSTHAGAAGVPASDRTLQRGFAQAMQAAQSLPAEPGPSATRATQAAQADTPAQPLPARPTLQRQPSDPSGRAAAARATANTSGQSKPNNSSASPAEAAGSGTTATAEETTVAAATTPDLGPWMASLLGGGPAPGKASVVRNQPEAESTSAGQSRAAARGSGPGGDATASEMTVPAAGEAQAAADSDKAGQDHGFKDALNQATVQTPTAQLPPAAAATTTVSTTQAAAGMAYSAEVAAPVGTPEFAPGLSAQVTLMLTEGLQEARLQLNPPEMGPVTVHIAVDGQNAQVSMSAEQAGTRQALEAALPTLAGALREEGLTLTGGGVFELANPPTDGAAAEGRGQGQRPADEGATHPRGSRTGHSDRDGTNDAILSGTGSRALQGARSLVDLVA